MSKGLMIVCDGSNGAGKSTVIKAIADHLSAKGHEIVLTREPGGTPIGEKIREVVLCPDTPEMDDTTELLLFAAARSQHVKEKIIPAVMSGKVVICDRFDSATRSFQGYGRGLSLELIEQLNSIALDGFTPDMNIILDLEPEEGMKRVKSRGEGFDRMEIQQMEFLNKAREGYLIQAKNNPSNYEVIDASQPLERVLTDVLSVVDHLVD